MIPEQVADYLQVSLEQVMTMLNSGDMPGFEIAKGHWRVGKNQLNNWIEEKSQPRKIQASTSSVKASNRNSQSSQDANRKAKSHSNSSSKKVEAERLYREALVARAAKEYNKARALFDAAIEASPSPSIFEAYAAMEKQVSREKALLLLDKGIQLFPNAGALYDLKAMLLKQRHELVGAIETLKRGLEIAPKQSIAKRLHRSLSEVLLQLGDLSTFEEAYKHAIKAKELGMNVEKAPFYMTLCFWKEPVIGQRTFKFFKAAGFELMVTAMNDEFADALITTNKIEFTDTYKLNQEILVRCFFKDTRQIRIKEILQTLKEAKYKNFNRDICFIVREDIRLWVESLYQVSDNNNEIIVPIDNSVLEQASDEISMQLLQQLLDQWYGRRDLFQYQYPVSGRRFYGRELDLQALRRNIDDGLSTGIYGLRKVGKTSLIRQLKTERTKDIVVSIDLQEITEKDCNRLYWKISKELRSEIKKIQFEATDTILENLNLLNDNDFSGYDGNKDYAQKFDDDIEEILSLDSTTPLFGGKVVIIIDEIELLLPVSGGDKYFKNYFVFLAHLRGIAHRAKGRFVNIVVAANPIISEQSRWDGRDNPMFQFYQEKFLPLLTQEDCSYMVSELGRRMSVLFDEESLELIFYETGGHPYITRQFCSHITQIHKSRPLYVNSEIVKSSIDRFLISGSATFSEINERLESDFPLEQKILLKIVNGVSSYSQLRQLVQGTIDLAIKHLVGYQIIDYQDEQYFIKINLLHRWLKKNYF